MTTFVTLTALTRSGEPFSKRACNEELRGASTRGGANVGEDETRPEGSVRVRTQNGVLNAGQGRPVRRCRRTVTARAALEAGALIVPFCAV